MIKDKLLRWPVSQVSANQARKQIGDGDTECRVRACGPQETSLPEFGVSFVF
jgi:hypothetical protein